MNSPARYRFVLFSLLVAVVALGLTTYPTAGTNAARELRSPSAGGGSARPLRPQSKSTPAPTPTPDPNLPATPTPTPTPARDDASKSAAVTASAAQAFALSSSGSLSGRMLTPVTPRGVDLTAEGTADWAHWGLGGAAAFDRKAGAQQISNYSRIGASATSWLNDNLTNFSWSDGTPTGVIANTQSGIYTSAAGNGFELTVPVDANLKTLKLYVGLFYAQGRLEATLSDASAPAFVDTSFSNNGGTGNAVYVISFNAASAGQTLRIKYTVQSDYFAPNGNVTLEAATLVNGGDPNAAPVVSIAAPADAATIAPGQSVPVTANAVDADGVVRKVEFYADGVSVGLGTPSGTDQFSLTWSNVFAGSHALTVVATDDEGATGTSTVNITALSSSGGSLSGGLSTPPTPRSVNLTAEGTADWAHWGLGGAAAFDRKAGAQQISNYSRIGASATSWLNDNPTTFSWSDGTPTVSAANTPTGVFTSSAGNGFELTVPADTSRRTLKLNVGLWYSQSRLEAVLSDGSAPALVDTSFGGSSGVLNGVYTISYSAASSGQALRIRYTAQTDFNPPFGNVSLIAATLINDPNSVPSVSITSPSPGATINAQSSLTINANASDADGTVSKVEFFQGVTKLGEATTSPYGFTWAGVPAGSYSITAVATDDDGATATSAPVGVYVNAPPATNAGPDQGVTLPSPLTIYGSVADDGLPSPPSSAIASWSKISGPGTVTFTPANAAVTTASFSSEGAYVLRLTAADGALTATDDVTINVYTAATLKLAPTADAHVKDGASAAANFGTVATMEAQASATSGENRDAYFKFDLTTSGDISSAKLRVFAALAVAGSVSTSVYPVSNTAWTETALTWNNKPPLGSPVLDTKTVNGTAFAWYEFDVTNYLAGEKRAGRNVVTLALHNPSTSATFIKLNSKEATTNKPELVIGTPEKAFVTGKTPGMVRNNFTGFVGAKITVGGSPLTVTSLGRIFVTGNTGTHAVKLVTASSGADVAGGSVSVNTAAGVAANGFKYAALPAPVTLAANTAYYVVSQETSGADQWYDSNTTLTTTPDAAVNSAIQRSSTSWVVTGGANNSYVPVDFKYAVKTSAPSAAYHLHQEVSATGGLFQLKEAAPDAISSVMQTADLKAQATGEKLISAFDTQAVTPGKSGYVPVGAQATFSVWMKNTGTVGTMLPLVKLNLNSPTGASVCSAAGATALTATLTKYTLTCVAGANVTVSATDRYYLWVGVNLTAGSTTKSFKAELEVEGTLNGNFDSQIVAPLPLNPTIYRLSPSLGPTGTSVTITGANFGAMQGASTVAFNGLAAVVTGWGDSGVVAQVPAAASTGVVTVVVAGAASNGVTFTVGPSDSDADGLPDWWELQYFGNLDQGAGGDPDGDGISNLQEFRQGRNPAKGGVADIGNVINLKVYTPLIP
jgi:hypothetical protein